MLVLEELMSLLRKRAGLEKSLEIFDALGCLISDILNVTHEDILMLRDFAEKYPSARYRDLLHLSIMINNGITSIYTTDNEFSNFKELTCLNPINF